MGKRIDLTGQSFGKLKVIKYEGKNKYGTFMYLCQCDCGNRRICSSSHLNAKYFTSCGCDRKEDLTGNKYGRLVAVNRVGNNEYLCQCDCGNYIMSIDKYLRNGHKSSCGCLAKEQRTELMRINSIKPIEGTRIEKLNDKLQKNNTSGTKGVYKVKNKNIWRAFIYFKGTRYNLGSYDNDQVYLYPLR